MTAPSWTADRVEKLIKLYAAGYSCSQIAMELGGITRNAVIGKTHRLKLDAPASRRAPSQRVQRAKTPDGLKVVSITGRIYRVPAVKPLPQFEETAQPPVNDDVELVDMFPGTGSPVCIDCKGPNDCSAIVSADDATVVMYCGQSRGLNWRGERSSYCPTHHARYFVQPKRQDTRRPTYRGAWA